MLVINLISNVQIYNKITYKHTTQFEPVLNVISPFDYIRLKITDKYNQIVKIPY